MADDFKLRLIIDADSRRAKSEIKSVEGQIKGMGRTASRAFASFAGNVAANAVQSLSSAFIDAARSTVQFSADMEQAQIGFETMTGSVEKASEHLKELQEFARRTPFDVEGMVRASQQMQALGFRSEEVIPLLNDVGNALSAAGRLNELPQAVKALADIQAKGKLAGQEIIQLANAGIPAREILAKELGVSTQKVVELGEQGKISADVFISAFQKFSREKFGDSMERQSNTFSGAIANIEDTLQIASAEAFKPLYQEISKVSVELANEIDRQEGDLEAIGDTIAQYIGRGMGQALSALGKSIATNFVDSFKQQVAIDMGKIDVNSIGGFFANLEEGIDQGLWRPLLGDDLASRFGIDTSTSISGGLGLVTSGAKELSSAVRNMPSLAEKLELSSLKRAHKDFDLLVDLTSGLSKEIALFGNETREAAVRQDLLSKGISGFSSGLARLAIDQAKHIDRLNRQDAEQKKFISNLENARSELEAFTSHLDFGPEMSALEQFDSWIGRIGDSFKDLRAEIDLTRAKIGASNFVNLTTQMMTFQQNLRSGITRTITDAVVPATKFEAALLSIGAQIVALENVTLASNLSDGFGNSLFPQGFALEIERHLEEIEKGTVMADRALVNYLVNLAVLGKDGAETRLFGEKSAKAFIERALGMRRALNALEASERTATGLQQLDTIMGNLTLHIGEFGAKSESQKLFMQLSDPTITAGIEARAAALGMTAEGLKGLIIVKSILGKVEADANANPELIGAASGTGLFDSLRDEIGLGVDITKITSEAEAVKAVYRDMAGVAGESITQMVRAGQELLASFILTGAAGADAIKALVAQTIAAVAVESGVKAVFQLAEGWAAAARYDYAAAAKHFAAAKIYGTVAGVAAATGVGIGLAGGLGGGSGSASGSRDSSNAGAPDYIPIQSNAPIQTSTPSPEIQTLSTVIAGLDQRVATLGQHIGDLDSKVKGMKPGDVLTAGIKQKGQNFVAQKILSDLSRNSTLNTKLGRLVNKR